MKLDVNDLCDEIDEKKIKLKKEFDKIANKKIDIEELDDNLVEIYNNKCKTLFEEQAIVIDRWNKFTEFRKKHYIREVEERIEESGIINDILKLTFNNVKINKYKINSKNYEDYGEISDYKKYIYDCIDSEEEQL